MAIIFFIYFAKSVINYVSNRNIIHLFSILFYLSFRG